MGELEYHLTIKDLPDAERPRERLFREGSAALSVAELLGILLGVGRRGETAVELGARILKRLDSLGGLRGLGRISPEELGGIAGVGPAKAARLKAAVELGLRLEKDQRRLPAIRSPADAAAILQAGMRYLDQERFEILLLDTKNRCLAREVIFVGGLDSTPVHPREVFQSPIRRGAAAVILAHNHPSGDPWPSADDLRVTRELANLGSMLGIEVLDHLIIGENCYLSLQESGLGWDGRQVPIPAGSASGIGSPAGTSIERGKIGV